VASYDCCNDCDSERLCDCVATCLVVWLVRRGGKCLDVCSRAVEVAGVLCTWVCYGGCVAAAGGSFGERAVHEAGMAATMTMNMNSQHLAAYSTNAQLSEQARSRV
jgi:hypothetical protein